MGVLHTFYTKIDKMCHKKTPKNMKPKKTWFFRPKSKKPLKIPVFRKLNFERNKKDFKILKADSAMNFRDLSKNVVKVP